MRHTYFTSLNFFHFSKCENIFSLNQEIFLFYFLQILLFFFRKNLHFTFDIKILYDIAEKCKKILREK